MQHLYNTCQVVAAGRVCSGHICEHTFQLRSRQATELDADSNSFQCLGGQSWDQEA